MIYDPATVIKALMTGAGENYLPFVFPRDDNLQGHIVKMRSGRITGDKVLGKISV